MSSSPECTASRRLAAESPRVTATTSSNFLPQGAVVSEQIDDLDSLPFPRWDLVTEDRSKMGFKFFTRPVGGGYPLLASRGCPEFCTYCPHRILAGYRARSIAMPTCMPIVLSNRSSDCVSRRIAGAVMFMMPSGLP